MRRLLPIALILALAALLAPPSRAADQNTWCQATPGTWTPCAGSSGSSTVNAVNPLPTLAPGAQTPQASLAGAAYTQPVFGSSLGGGTPVDATHGLPVNVIAGSSGNAAASATGSAVPADADYQGLNNAGTLVGAPGDGTNGAWVNVKTSVLPTGAAQETGGNLATIAGAVTSSVVQSNTKQVNGVTTLAGAGAVGTGSQRVAVGQDTTTLAGSAPGTAGTPSVNVVSMQGVSGGTPAPVSAASGAIASGAVASGALAAGAGVDGWDVTKGAKGDSACGTATGTCSLIALLKFLNTAASGAIPAGTNSIGILGNTCAGASPLAAATFLSASSTAWSSGRL